MSEAFLSAPPHWRRATLAPDGSSEIITHVDCGGTPRTSEPDNWDGDIPWLTPKEVIAVSEAIYIVETERTISQRGLKSCAAQLLPPGTVMLTKRAPIGYVVINAVPMATNQGFLNFRCGPLLDPVYLAYWLRINRPYLELVANGTMYPELHQSDLFEFEIAIPPLEEQRAILQAVHMLEYLINMNIALERAVATAEEILERRQLSRFLHETRNSMLPLLFSGLLKPAWLCACKEHNIAHIV